MINKEANQNMYISFKVIALFVIMFLGLSVYGQKVEIQDVNKSQEVSEPDAFDQKPKTGKGAAQKYFAPDANATTEESTSSKEHYLMLGLSFYFDSDAYRWGPSHYEDPSEWSLGVTYRFGEWLNSTDFLVRVEYQFFDLDGNENPQKLSFVPLIIFPDARSEFPLYFGLGAGLGLFTKQINDESHLSLDYQIFLGLRFFDLLQNTGFFVESGLKNHFHLLSSGQLNSVYLSFGSVFTF